MKCTRSLLTSSLGWGVLVMLPLALSGCASGGSAEAAAEAAGGNVDQETVEAFVAWVEQVVDDTEADPDYQRIPLDTQDQIEWFEGLMFTAWDKRITPDQFVEQGLTKYPDYRESLEFIAARLP